MWAMEITLKDEMKMAKSIKERTGLLMSVARLKLKKLIDMEIHNQYASETNAEHGYLGYSIVPMYNTRPLTDELFPAPKREEIQKPICSCDGVCDDCLPF